MPVRFSACSSLIHKVGKTTSEAATLFIAPGVDWAWTGGVGGAGLMVMGLTEDARRITRLGAPGLAFCRYQKLRV